MKKTFDFGKIDFEGLGRKCNAVTVDMEYKEDGDKKRFSVSASVWNAFHSDIVAGGQCLDSLQPYFKLSPTFTEIFRLWKLYHLNDMHAACIHQAAQGWEEQAAEKSNALRFHYDNGSNPGAGRPETPDFDSRPKRGSMEDKPG